MPFINRALLALKRIFIVIGIAIAFSVGLFGAIVLSLRSSETTVPDIVGKDRTAAENAIVTAGLNFRVRATRAVSDSKPNTVLIQVPNSGVVVPSPNGLFAATPYESAPPEVQRKVIADAQKRLARRGLFKNEIDGSYGPALEFSLRAYQARVGLPSTGRLDLETLAALELLPGAHMPVYPMPRRGLRERPEAEPPVRGEWIRP